MKLKNNDLAWNLVKKLKKVLFLAGDIIYTDNSASESMYFVQYGDVKLVAINQFTFATFSSGDTLG